MPITLSNNLFPEDLGLEMDMSKMSMPYNSSYGATGWADGLPYSPDVFIEDRSFDYFSMFSTNNSNNNAAAPVHNDFMSWPAAQPFAHTASPANCFGFPDNDYLSEGGAASPGELTDGSSPRGSSSSSSDRKRDRADDSDSSAAEEPESPRAAKKTRPSPRFGKAAAKAPGRRSTSTTTTASSPTSAKPSVGLRTAPRKPKPEASKTSPSAASPATPEEDLTAEEQRARQSHNLVEKKYRNRLNAQFEQLLAVLPADEQRDSKRGGSQDGEEKRMSKGDVLDLARRRIRALEDEKARLQAERQALLEQSNAMRGLASPVLM